VNHTTAPRLAPLPRERWGADARDALRAAWPEAAARFLADAPDAPSVPNVLSTLMHHPALAGRFLAYNRVLLETPAMGHRLRELLVLRVAWRTQATYEWAQHTRIAASVGVTPEEIDAIASVGGDHPWAPLEADQLAAADQLVDHACIDEATWARLAVQLDEPQPVEPVFAVGTCTCLAMACNSFGMQLDAELEPATLPTPGRVRGREE
jgi:alkylhydroperoxidase family enzyme